MAKKFVKGTELVQAGFANGISTQLAQKGFGKSRRGYSCFFKGTLA